MIKCKLCLVNEADKKGSHIVPAFILKTLFERNKEFVVSIGNQAVGNHVGRDLTPEKIQEYMGRDLTDEEIIENEIPFIEDYILCTNCENRLGHIESIYASIIHQNISKNKCDKDSVLDVKGNGGLISLFWYSVIWRYSINEKNPFNLNEKDLKKLRFYVNNNLKDTQEGLKKHLIESINNYVPYPIGVFFNSNQIKKVSSNTVVGMPNYRNPYLLFFNEYAIILYFKPSQINGMLHSFYGLEESFSYKKMINYHYNDFKIGVIKNEVFEKVKENLFLQFSRIKHERFVSMFTFVANHYGLVFNDAHIKAFINRILSDDTHIADKYDRTRVLTILMEELNKLPKR